MKPFAIAFAALAVALTSSVTKASEQSVTWKMAHFLPPSHPLSKGLAAWADSIAKASGGKLKIRIYPAQQLGKAFDDYDMARDGIAEIALMSPGYTPGRFPIANATALPFLISNGIRGTRAVDEWYRAYAPREMKDVRYCAGMVHDPGALHLTSKKVLLPSDMKGLKIRPAGGTVGAFMISLGATTVQASPPEARQVLARGVADGITFPWHSIIFFKIDQVTKFHMDVPFYTSHMMLVINRSAYAKLGPNQKKVLDAHCSPDSVVKIVSPWNKWEAAGRVKMKSLPGHVVYSLTAKQVAAWRKAAAPIRAKWAASVSKAGGDPKAVMGALKAALRKHDAAYE